MPDEERVSVRPAFGDTVILTTLFPGESRLCAFVLCLNASSTLFTLRQGGRTGRCFVAHVPLSNMLLSRALDFGVTVDDNDLSYLRYCNLAYLGNCRFSPNKSCCRQTLGSSVSTTPRAAEQCASSHPRRGVPSLCGGMT